MMMGMQGMRIAMLLALFGCGGSQSAGTSPPGSPPGSPPAATTTRQPVTCGAATCGVDEYCEQKCTCCGAYIPDPSQASGTSTCLPLPPACHGSDAPECMQREVAIPCA
jgi:hypothetical protein